MRYLMKDTREGNTHKKGMEYTFWGLKKFFEPEKECQEEWKEWERVRDLCGLKEWLEERAGGEVQSFEIETVEETDEIYKNYGVLAHEYVPQYTYGAQAELAKCSDLLTIEIPDGWSLVENACKEVVLESPWGELFPFGGTLAPGDEPKIVAYDKRRKKYEYKLKIVE